MSSEVENLVVGSSAMVDGIGYRVVGVKHGGMGVVRLLKRTVAGDLEPVVYKALLAAKTFNDADDIETRKLVTNELKHWLPLKHQNVVELLALGDLNFQLAALMPVAQTSIEELRVERGVMPVASVVEVLRQAACGLEYAWSTRHLLHLDVKPANLLVMGEDGGRRNVCVSDWGMSAVRSASHGGSKQGGTLPYMAPERFVSEAQQSCSWDVFSLGITFLRLTTNEFPLDVNANIPNQLVSGAYLGRAASLLGRTNLHTHAQRAVLFLIHPNPQQRISNYGDVYDALDEIGRNRRWTFPWTRKQLWA